MADVVLANVTKAFGEVIAVNDVSLSCEHGEFLVLLGPSGSGKTTLLRLIAGLEQVTAGEIMIGDRVVTAVPPKDRDIAMVFQNYALYPHMKVTQNMSLALRRRRVPREVIRTRVVAAATFLQIERLLDRLPRQLSGGQQQRVAVGRAIVREPKVFLMDEPLSNLDARLRMETRRELIKLHRRLGATFIYVTHDQSEAMTMATRVVIMRDGVLQQYGSPLEVFNHPVNKYVAGFMGETQMNFLEGRLATQNSSLRLLGEGFDLELPPFLRAAAEKSGTDQVVLGVRPEYLQIAPEPASALSGKVETFEPVGSRALMSVTLAEGTVVTIEVPSEPVVEPGTAIGLSMDWRRVHLFDSASEVTLTSLA